MHHMSYPNPNDKGHTPVIMHNNFENDTFAASYPEKYATRIFLSCPELYSLNL